MAGLGLLATILVLIVNAWLSYRNVHRLSVNEGWVVHTYEVLDVLQDLITGLTETESGGRGYVITGDNSYLEPFEKNVAALRGQVTHLQQLTIDNPTQQARLPELEQKVQARVDLSRRGIEIRTAQGLEEAQRFVMSAGGKEQMQAVRDLIDKMKATENDLLHIRQKESTQSYRTALATLSTSTALGLALVLLAYGLVRREQRTRAEGLEALAHANDVLETRVIERTSDLNLANESLRRSNRELEQFASVASHDLQEPLRKIQAFGDRLQTRCAPELGEQGKDYLSRMQASAGRMRSLIDALLTFSRVTTKAQPFVQLDLAATAQDVVSDLEDQIRRGGGQVEVGALPMLEADPLQMRQLLQNLIGNALKFSRPGEAPHVRVQSRALEPITNGNGDSIAQCEITVSDNGIGFEEVYLDRIFELFQRLHGRQEYEGTGMGLAICRKIVERHRGTITAKSAPDQGSTFVVTLPLSQS